LAVDGWRLAVDGWRLAAFNEIIGYLILTLCLIGQFAPKNRQPPTANRQRFPFVISPELFTFAAQLIFFKQKQGNEQL
jgi:hypothetical protein